MPKLVILHKLPEEDVDRIRAVAPEWDVVAGGDKELAASQVGEAEVLVGWSKLAEERALKEHTPLRWVQHWGAGVDRLPLERFAARGVTLTNASGVHASPISETILGMMLALTRKLHQAVRRQGERRWGVDGTLGEIHGKTIGMIGVGAIGEETARLAQAFGMRVLGVRRSGKPAPYVDQMVDLSGLSDVVAASDYVVVTLPLTDETRHLFDRERFRLMKPSAYFINIGRGGTTDTEALIEALREGRIAGAGLDVFEQEPLPEDSPLWAMDNVVMTPHNAGSTDAYTRRAMDILLFNLKDYIAGRPLSRNVVDLEKQY